MLAIRIYRALAEYCIEVAATQEPAGRGDPSGRPHTLNRHYFPSEGTPTPAQICFHLRTALQDLDGYAGDLADQWDRPGAPST